MYGNVHAWNYLHKYNILYVNAQINSNVQHHLVLLPKHFAGLAMKASKISRWGTAGVKQ